jgi:hypothetical protein
MKRHLIGVAAAVLSTMLMGGVVVQTASAADPLPTTVELPLFGAPLTLGITTGPGGALTEVTVAPATNVVAHKLSPRKVVFKAANAAGDSAKIEVKSKKGGQSVSVRAGSLANVSGPGSWSGDLFGTGVATTVEFTIGATADGGPDITGVTTSDVTAVTSPVKYSSDDDDDEIEQSARVSIKFTDPASDQSRTLTIKVKVEEEDDGEIEAKLSISLSRLKGVAVLAAEAAGPHTWTGLLCDNTTATINYTLDADGSIVTDSATATATPPNTAEVRTDDNKIDVRFSGGERVRIKVKSDDGMIRIDVKERIRCDSPDPTTNATTTTTSDDDDDDDDDGENRGRGGRDDDDDDDGTSTTDVTSTIGA